MFYQAKNFAIYGGNFTAVGGDDINKIHKWLNAPNCSTNYATTANEKCSGTGEWIFDLDTYKKWESNPGALAGSGKTFLITTIYENLKKMNQSPVWYHYFDIRDNTESKTTYSGFLLSLVQQMGLSSESIHPALNTLYKSKPFEQLTNWELENILETLMKDRNDMTIAVDALDECQKADTNEVFNWLAAFSNQLRIVVTSRLKPELVVQNLCHIELGGPKSRIDEDIASYIELKIQDQRRFKGDIIGEIKDTLNKGAHGIFRWVDCQMMELQKCTRNKDVKEVLKTLPATLTETYNQVLGRLTEKEKKDAQNLLLWLLYAFEPLTRGKANEIWKIDLLEQKFDPDEMDLLVEVIPSTFVTVGQDDIIQLAHASVKEYLISYPQSKEISHSLLFNEHLAHDIMTQTTIIYLMQYEKASFEKEGLVAYAVKYWLSHASKVEESKVEGQSQKLICAILKDNVQFSKWQEMYINNIDLPRRRTAGPLYYGALNGLYGAVKYLIQGVRGEKHHVINAQGGYIGNALQAASYGGHESIVRLLLENDADVNAQGGEYGNALQAASFHGHESIVKLLLENNADSNVHGGHFGNALQAASVDGHESIVKLLLESNTDVSAQGGYYGNALQAASLNGHESIVKLLLENNADVNEQGGKYGNTLQAASLNGHESIVKLLLENNADVNAHGGEYGNTLQAASLNGHESIVKLLLENNADVNAHGGEYGNTLQAASLNGHESIVKLLLENNADVNAHGGEYGNALQAASLNGHESIVKLLLECNADVNAHGGHFGNALQAASLNGHESIVKLLLECNADLNAHGGHFGNALQAASWNGHESIVKLLLENNADVNTHGGRLGNALQAALVDGHESIVKLLLENNADVNAQGGQYGNALQVASWDGHDSIVKLLLENDADVNAQGGKYGNALQAASCWGHESIVKLLLENNAGVNAQGGEYGNALQAASWDGHDSILKLLLENDADVNAQGGKYGNALQAASVRGYESIVKLLLENDADVNAQGGKYGNALQAASLNGHKSVVKLLLENDADVNAQGGEYGNALQAASIQRHRHIMQLLLQNGALLN
ncbi:ankyrin repeat-containing domain protein [Lentinula aff. lateritia]|uniref:Ankyrin repeat-containing domain protein n=1 Tax=Lentinula aff. lateritia TaxID=2804960 RepID=A0ACC1TIA5_9AGAR|nr:ankyrin repeat-containing domain protein [Lentinula aff. lateritia]